ncbi:hypothetical protein [Embleya scabrispora]|uniref:hypothetical protein n=1 Tax=Embleya scabrispora TaxID=159449 RepID=UPI00036576E9|nr:hypothetical protein [Embleya scabrispora]MYS80729.1 hypothetical protein [Streptomyces sp. SID5474]
MMQTDGRITLMDPRSFGPGGLAAERFREGIHELHAAAEAVRRAAADLYATVLTLAALVVVLACAVVVLLVLLITGRKGR